MPEIRSSTVLDAVRENIEFTTADGLKLVGELALPRDREPVATIIALHPLPTAGGFMDSHVLRKASWRLPALANIAVLRFNTRGTSSPRGTSEGEFGDGITERFDVAAAVEFAKSRGLGNLWLVGWSFGTELALKYGPDLDITGAILLSPPVRRTNDEELKRWSGDPRKVVALIPACDDFLRPAGAREKFAPIEHLEQIDVPEGKHLWVGETQTRIVLNEIVRAINPSAHPLPTVVPDDAVVS